MTKLVLPLILFAEVAVRVGSFSPSLAPWTIRGRHLAAAADDEDTNFDNCSWGFEDSLEEDGGVGATVGKPGP